MNICVSTGEGIGVLSESGALLRHAALDGAGALCASGGHLLCACDRGRAIWRLSEDTLMPEGLLPGGPGVCDMIASADGNLLYMLCGEADSVVMADMRSGQPLLLRCVGCNPRQMALEGDVLAVAGGEDGQVHLLDARTLDARERLSMPGPVYSVAFRSGALHALCATPSLDTTLVTLRANARHARDLRGLPGQMCFAGDRLLMLDAFNERLLAFDARAARWRTLHAHARGVCVG